MYSFVMVMKLNLLLEWINFFKKPNYTNRLQDDTYQQRNVKDNETYFWIM